MENIHPNDVTKHGTVNDGDKNEAEKEKLLPKKKVPKKKYFPKGNHYKKYRDAPWVWEDVFKFIERIKAEGEYHFIRVTSELYCIKYSTLKNKYAKWSLNNELNPADDDRGGHNKSFTEEQERNLFEWIVEVYIKNDLFFDNESLKISAKKIYGSLYPKEINTFKASKGWICSFKEKWQLSSFIARKSKKATNIDASLTEKFLADCQAAIRRIPLKFVFNMDETFWRTLNGKLNVIGITGSDNRNLVLNINDKEGFTAIFIVAADGNFLKPIVVLKGKTSRCLKKITGDDIDASKIQMKYSDNGWVSVSIMIFMLKEIHKITKGEESVLILDQFSVHMCDAVKKVAEKLNITFIYVPSGRTAENQPLDVGINGPIKSIGRRIIKEIYMMDPFIKDKLTIKNAVKALIESKDEITKETIEKSFVKALNL